MASSSGFRNNDEDSINRETKGPLEYLKEMEECICGWCGQLLIHTNETAEMHFKRCKNSKESGLLMIFAELRKVQRYFRKINAEMSEMKNKLETMKSEVMQDIKAHLFNLKAVFNERILDLIAEINKHFHAKTRETNDGALFDKVKTLENRMIDDKMGAVVVKRKIENEVEKKVATKKKKSVIIDVETLPPMIILMNCFNLVTHNYLFEPSFRWNIKGIKKKLEQKLCSFISKKFYWNGYPVAVKAKIAWKKDDGVYLSMRLKDESEFLTLTPQAFYLLNDRRASDILSARHKCTPQFLSGSAFAATLALDVCIGHKDWLKDSTYQVDDSIEIDIYVEPPLMAELVYSWDGTLNWTIENYARRVQLETEGLVYNQESPYFYTSRRGYRVQVEMYLNGNEDGAGVMVHVSFLKGKFDRRLPKSFPHSTTVSLIHPKEPESRSISKSIAGDIKNKKFYSIEIGKLNEIENFINDDTLSLKVSIIKK